MLLLSQEQQPVAALDIQSNTWAFSYLPNAKKEINPALPLDNRQYLFNGTPRFLMGILPEGHRVQRVTGKISLTNEDYRAVVSKILDLENIGDLQVSYEGRDEDIKGITRPSGKNVFVDSGMEKLEDPQHRRFILERIGQRFYAAGLAGTRDKLFYRCPEGEYIIKVYDYAFMAAIEAASLEGFSKLGGIVPQAKAYDKFLVARRFDIAGDQKKHSVCGLSIFDNKPRQSSPEGIVCGSSRDPRYGSYESILTPVIKVAGIQAGQMMVKRILFSYILGDTDSHKDNFALLRKATTKGWNLAPAFDMLPNQHEEPNIDLCLTINGKNAKLEFQDFVKLGKMAGMEEKEVRQFMQDSCTVIISDVFPHLPPKIRNSYSERLDYCRKIIGGATKSVHQERTTFASARAWITGQVGNCRLGHNTIVAQSKREIVPGFGD